jgi:ESCRT-II complex subunit VPS36
MEIAHEEGITVGLAGEMIGAVENDGDVCRDDGSAAIKGGGSGTGFELRWWMNVFKDYIWDGQDCISR